MSEALDREKLENEIKSIYKDVAESAEGDFHFETGRELAEKLGYEATDLNEIPRAAIDSYAGVGYYFDMADLKPGEKVLDLGSGSGMDTFVATLYVTESGTVTGIDMTEEQVQKASSLADDSGFKNVTFHRGYIEKLSFEDEMFDVVMSNGVINLSAEKERVFAEISRVLKPGGRLVLADIISEDQLPEGIKNDADLWASCIGGASQKDSYISLIEKAGMEVQEVRDNNMYEFISESADNASQKYGIKSISLLARKN